MDAKTKALTRSALSAAVGVAVLYLCCVFPWGRLALLCVASLGVIFVRMSCPPYWAIGCYSVTALLGLLLLPEKAPALAYAVLFGYYPLVRLLTERLASPWARMGVRLAVFNAAALLTYFAFRAVFTSLTGDSPLPLYLLWAAVNGAFLVYDYALGQIILYYVRNLSGRFR